jgi:hypothetical protein
VLTLLLSTALAGYGDPVGGLPSPTERELHAWTDVARVGIDVLAPDLRCWSDIPADQKVPVAALAWSADLAEAARAHTEDMAATGKMTHRSSDGTRFADRVWSYYTGYRIGENVAEGYRTPRRTVLAWLCSAGHRDNLLGDWAELGTGNVGTWWTQDFGMSRRPPGPPLRMGAHSPAVPTSSVKLLADVEAPAAPKRVTAWLDGVGYRMSVYAGAGGRAVYAVDVPVGAGCHAYRFVARLADGTVARFPATGAYGFGDCAWTDPDAQWLDGAGLAAARAGVTSTSTARSVADTGALAVEDVGEPASAAADDTDDADDTGATGCSVAPTPASGSAALLLLAALRRRRARR